MGEYNIRDAALRLELRLFLRASLITKRGVDTIMGTERLQVRQKDVATCSHQHIFL